MNVISSWDELALIFKKKFFKNPDYGEVTAGFAEHRSEVIWEGKIFSNGKLNCRISGYGRDNSNKSGPLHTAEFKYSYSVSRTAGYFKVPSDDSGGNYIDPTLCGVGAGDSGGPLYCQEPKNNEWILIGMMQAEMSRGEHYYFSFVGSEIFHKVLKEIQDEK